MTKDWDSVRFKIRDLSVNQKKSLEEVKSTMEIEHRFRASTRAYRMKLKEWGYMRHKSNRGTTDKTNAVHQDRNTSERNDEERDEAIDGADDSESSSPTEEQTIGITTTLLEEANDLIPIIDPWTQGGMIVSDIVMDMLACVLEADSQRLEQLIVANPTHINLPIGTPFDVPGGRFFNHPAIQQCVILQHPNQTIMDIACALPAGPVVWVLVANGGNGSTHPLGTDLAFHNAIKNGRSITVQSLLFSNRSSVNGIPGRSWKPLLQAAFWNVPDIVRILLDRGANVNDNAPMLDGIPLKNALQLTLARRSNNYHDKTIRERSERILKMLLDSGANIYAPPAEDLDELTPFEIFIKPWQTDPHWATHLSSAEIHCLEAFVRKGADISVPFHSFPCSAPSGETFEHQILWHSTPTISRLLIDRAIPSPEANGSNMLHEILGSCPDAKRHPTDTLRDIEVLIQRGADPNLPNSHGSTPLRTCIERCPAVDILPRLQALLDGGADPESKAADGILPFAHAARTFEEPLKSQVLHTLVSKFRGRCHQVWHERYFPIPSSPTLAQVLLYTPQNGGFLAETQRTVPEDVREEFQRASFSVASQKFLDAKVEQLKLTADRKTMEQEADDLRHVVAMRQGYGMPAYKFDQEFVMSLLFTFSLHAGPQPNAIGISIPTSDDAITQSMITDSIAHLSFPTPLGQNLPTALTLDLPIASPNTERRSSTSSEGSALSFFIPTTTQIRWPAVDTPTKSGDLKKASARVLKYTCSSCTNDRGNFLTKAELRKHEDEHLHTLTCEEMGCRRRFCVAERGSERAEFS